MNYLASEMAPFTVVWKNIWFGKGQSIRLVQLFKLVDQFMLYSSFSHQPIIKTSEFVDNIL